MDRRKKILVFANAIEKTFNDSDWVELGYLTGTDKWINKHPRLLRSLAWGDDDYKGCVLDAVSRVLDSDSANVERLIAFPAISTWLQSNDPGFYQELIGEITGIEVPNIEPATITSAGLAALADAQVLLRERGPLSAIDRIHTGLHAFLRAACVDVGLEIGKDPTANQLLKLLLNDHPDFDNLGPHSDRVKTMIRTSASIIDTLGTLRNRGSLAHDNEKLLDYDEALFAINLTRSLLQFLNAKLSRVE